MTCNVNIADAIGRYLLAEAHDTGLEAIVGRTVAHLLNPGERGVTGQPISLCGLLPRPTGDLERELLICARCQRSYKHRKRRLATLASRRAREAALAAERLMPGGPEHLTLERHPHGDHLTAAELLERDGVLTPTGTP